MLKMKNSAVSVQMMIGMIVISIMIIILCFFVIKTVISNQITEDNICPAVEIMLDSIYASPYNFNSAYHFPVPSIPKKCFAECLATSKCIVDPLVYNKISSSIDIETMFVRNNGFLQVRIQRVV